MYAYAAAVVSGRTSPSTRSPMMGEAFGRVGLYAVLLAGGLACSVAPDDGTATDDPDEIVGANSVARTATIQSYVLVRVGASDSEISSAVTKQIRPLFGALKAQEVGLGDRDANAID